MYSATILYALLIFVFIVFLHAVSLFRHARCYILPPLLLLVANAAFAVKTNDGVNFQLVGISSNFAENVWFNPCPSQPSDTRNDVGKTANVRRRKAPQAALWHADARPERAPMVFDRELEPACHDGRAQLAKTQSFGDRQGRSEARGEHAIVLALAQLHYPCPRPLSHELHLFWVPRYRSVRVRNALRRARRDGAASRRRRPGGIGIGHFGVPQFKSRCLYRRRLYR
jgi:hypothetical protein